MQAPPIRIIADDLTGALDAAAALAQRHGAFTVRWDTAAAPGQDRLLALDAGTREADRDDALAVTEAAARRWWRDFDGLAFKKVDSVWRGHAAAEIAAALRASDFDGAIVAPAFPEQGRVTREGAQWVRDASGERCVATDLVADLRAEGLSATREDGDGSVLVCDADSRTAMNRIVERRQRRAGRLLWCGSAGLAHALAASFDAPRLASPAHDRVPGSRIVVLVGTDHAVAQRQAGMLAAVEGVVERRIDVAAPAALPRDGDASIRLLRFEAPAGTSRSDARISIRRALRTIVPSMAAPTLAIVTGGETLRALAESLGATALIVHGERATGVARAAWRDGAWAGVPLYTKSGGFGAPDLFAELVASTHARSRD